MELRKEHAGEGARDRGRTCKGEMLMAVPQSTRDRQGESLTPAHTAKV